MAKIDVHAHLDLKQFEGDLDEVVSNASDSDVSVIINNGLDPKSNRKTVELAGKYSIVKVALGLYPGMDDETDVDAEIEWMKKQELVAVGEVGLDYYHEPYDKSKQIVIFKKMIGLAKDLDIPVIVHSRNAEKECIDILEEECVKKVVLHCFNGSLELVKRAEKLGYYFSVPCIITFAKQFQEIVKKVSITRLLTETDCPYMSPYKGKRNEPANVSVTIKKIAELKGFEEKETEDSIYLNYQRLFL